jgi:glycolate oxidase
LTATWYEAAEKVEAICRQYGATEVHAAKADAKRDRVWSARRAVLSALAQLKPTVVLEDATVPRSQIAAMIRAILEISRRFDLPIGTSTLGRVSEHSHVQHERAGPSHEGAG